MQQEDDLRGLARGKDNMGEDTLQPCGGCGAVFPELVAAGTSPATHGRYGILYRHVVGRLHLYAYGRYVDVQIIEKQFNG